MSRYLQPPIIIMVGFFSFDRILLLTEAQRGFVFFAVTMLVLSAYVIGYNNGTNDARVFIISRLQQKSEPPAE